MKEKLQQGLNLALMVDLFFVLICFFWLAAAVVGRSTGVPLGLEVWYRLWEPVIQPAMGILMAGALLTGVADWVAKRLPQKQ